MPTGTTLPCRNPCTTRCIEEYLHLSILEQVCDFLCPVEGSTLDYRASVIQGRRWAAHLFMHTNCFGGIYCLLSCSIFLLCTFWFAATWARAKTFPLALWRRGIKSLSIHTDEQPKRYKFCQFARRENVIPGDCPVVDEKKYGKRRLYLASSWAFSWGMALAQTLVDFCERRDETLVLAAF